MDVLTDWMQRAFRFYYPKSPVDIRLEGKIWSPEFKGKESVYVTESGLELEICEKYIDGRAKEEYEMFKKYFIRDEGLDLL